MLLTADAALEDLDENDAAGALRVNAREPKANVDNRVSYAAREQRDGCEEYENDEHEYERCFSAMRLRHVRARYNSEHFAMSRGQ